MSPETRTPTVPKGALLALAVAALLGVGCRQDMHDQPRIEPYEAHAFFADGRGSRIPPAGTVARGWLREDSRLWQGVDEVGNAVTEIPLDITRELLERGGQRYEIFCSVCHDSTGGGSGMIVRRGFKQPPPLYEQRLKDMPAGYFYDVITNGFGVMSSYSKQIPMEDRWAIVAYLRALQLSQTATLADLPEPMREEFHAAVAATEAPSDHPSAEEAAPGDTAASETGGDPAHDPAAGH